MAKKTASSRKKIPKRQSSTAVSEVEIRGVRVPRNQVGRAVQTRVNAGAAVVTATKLLDGEEYLIS